MLSPHQKQSSKGIRREIRRRRTGKARREAEWREGRSGMERRYEAEVCAGPTEEDSCECYSVESDALPESRGRRD